jgi:hypothetical protein
MQEEIFTNKYRNFQNVVVESSITGLSNALIFIIVYLILKDYIKYEHKLYIFLPMVFIASVLVTLVKEYTTGKDMCLDNKSMYSRVINILVLPLLLNMFLLITYIIPFKLPLKLFLINLAISVVFSTILEICGYNTWLCRPENQQYGTHTFKAK